MENAKQKQRCSTKILTALSILLLVSSAAIFVYAHTSKDLTENLAFSTDTAADKSPVENLAVSVELEGDITSVAPEFGAIAANTTNAGAAVRITCTNITSSPANVSGYIASWNNTGAWVNASWVSVGSAGVQGILEGTFNSTSNMIVGVRFYANDTDNDWSSSAIETFELSDVQDPTVANISASSTIAATSCIFSARWTDNEGLSGYIFSTNNTGSWTNNTWASLASNPSWANVTKTLTATAGAVVGYRWFCNDTSNNWGTSSIQTLTTTASNAPTIGEFKYPTTAFGNQYFYLNATVNDVDGVAQIKNATIGIAYGVVLAWDNATSTFSEQADPQNFCTLDAANSVITVKNSTAIEVSWYIKLSSEYPDGDVNIESANTKAFDTTGNSGSNSETAAFQFNDAVAGGNGSGDGTGDSESMAEGDFGNNFVNYVNRIAPYPTGNPVIDYLTEATHIPPLGIYAILGCLILITLGGIGAAFEKKQRKHRIPNRSFRKKMKIPKRSFKKYGKIPKRSERRW